jgi:hypothetical protein
MFFIIGIDWKRYRKEVHVTADAAIKTFEPSRYLTKLSRRVRGAGGAWTSVESDYLEVKWRLLWLRSEQPASSIETELVSHEDGMAVFRARVALPSGGSATGWGHETASGFDDYVEKAETKALGRALAALGYGTQFCEDFEFSQAPKRESDPIRTADSALMRVPISEEEGIPGDDTKPSNPAGGRRGPAATEPQVRAIYAIARGALALDEDALDERCRARYGAGPSELTRRQASEFIDELKNGAQS